MGAQEQKIDAKIFGYGCVNGLVCAPSYLILSSVIIKVAFDRLI